MLLAACEQFLGKAEQEIRRVALETLGEISVQWSDYFLTGHASNFSFDFFFLNRFQRDTNVPSWVQWLSR